MAVFPKSLLDIPDNITLTYKENVNDNNPYSYGPGGRYYIKRHAVTAAKNDGYSSPEALKIANTTQVISKTRGISFDTNPRSLQISIPTNTIKNSFIGQDGGIVKPTQLGFLTISGEGTFLAQRSSITGVEFNPIASFTQLQLLQEKKIPLRINLGFASYNIIIENLTLNISTRQNAVDFSFVFVETKIIDRQKTGFEFDRNIRKRRNTAIESIKADTTTATFFTSQAAKQSPPPESNETDEEKEIREQTELLLAEQQAENARLLKIMSQGTCSSINPITTDVCERPKWLTVDFLNKTSSTFNLSRPK